MSGLDTVPCAVCAGLGGWDRATFKPMRQGDALITHADWMRCPMCHGAGGYRPTVEPRSWS